jgi:hypothetical protein
MNLNVIDSGIVWPPNAFSFPNIEELPTYTGGYNQGTTKDGFPCDNGATTVTDGVWLTQRDCGTNGGKTGMTSTLTPGPGAPPTNTTAREYKLTSANAPTNATPGIRWSTRLTGTDVTKQHFGFDAWVYFQNDGSLGLTHALELDINQSTNAGNTLYIMSHQCNFDTGLWQVGGWTTTDQHCDRNMFSAGSWHHVQIKVRRDTTPDQIVFEQVAIDDVVQNLTCGGNPCTRGPTSPSSPWTPAGLIVPNFQINANQSTSSGITTYVDSFYIYAWPN